MSKSTKNQHNEDIDGDFIDFDDNTFLRDIDNESYLEKVASKRKKANIKKMRRIKEGLYDYFERKSLHEKNGYYD